MVDDVAKGDVADKPAPDCQSCLIIGTATMGGASLYMLHLRSLLDASKRAPRAGFVVASVGFAYAALRRAGLVHANVVDVTGDGGGGGAL
jgi:hypothetical protein